MKINNIEIFVEKIEGHGNLNFVLIHNAGGNHHFFTHQIEILKKYGNVIWLDLPGHSESKENASSYQMHALSLTISQLCKNLSLNNICLIGLNNGADIIIDAALETDLPIASLILIDPPIMMEKSFISEIKDFIHALESKDYTQFISTLTDSLFIHTSDENKTIAKNAFSHVDNRALQEIFRGLIEWDAQSVGKLKNIGFPTLCILTDEHHCTYSQLRKVAPQFEIGKVIGSKCWATLEVPEQVNAMIERFLKINGLGKI